MKESIMVKPANGATVFGLVTGLFILCAVSPASAATIQDFDTAGGTPFVGANYPNPTSRPPPVVVGPDANSSGNYLRLISGGLFTRSQNGVGFDRSDSGAYNRIVANFDFRITCSGARTGFSGGGCGDGFSFLLLDTAVHGTSGATGTPTLAEHGGLTLGGQFSLGFNTFFNSGFMPDAGSSNSLSMLVSNSFVPGSFVPLSLSTFDLATGLSGSKGPFHHATIDLMLGSATPKVTVSLTHGVSGITITPFSNFDLSGVSGLGPVERRVGFAVRCGDACADYNVDNINVQFLNPVAMRIPEPSTFAIFAFGLVGLGFMMRRRRKAVA